MLGIISTAISGNTKTCTKCGKEKDLSEFHKSKRFGHTHWCKNCFYLADQERKAKNPLAYKEQNKRKTSKYYHKDSQGKERLKKRFATNEKYRNQINDSKKTPKGKARVARYNETRRTNTRYDGKLTLEQEQELLRKQNFKCNCCGRKFSEKLPYTRDHIHPASKGGRLVMGNVQLLCRSCNSKKKDRI
jgi:5-methylcytosine-specific restriction endonuclease McrA